MPKFERLLVGLGNEQETTIMFPRKTFHERNCTVMPPCWRQRSVLCVEEEVYGVARDEEVNKDHAAYKLGPRWGVVVDVITLR